MSKYLCKPASRREWASRQAQEEVRNREKHGDKGKQERERKDKGDRESTK